MTLLEKLELNKKDRAMAVEFNKDKLTLRLFDLVEALLVENMCDACGGTGKPISGLQCMCNGTGSMSVAAVTLRKELVELRLKYGNQQEQKYNLCGD